MLRASGLRVVSSLFGSDRIQVAARCKSMPLEVFGGRTFGSGPLPDGPRARDLSQVVSITDSLFAEGGLERKRLLGLALAVALAACSTANFAPATGEGGDATPTPTTSASSEPTAIEPQET